MNRHYRKDFMSASYAFALLSEKIHLDSSYREVYNFVSYLLKRVIYNESEKLTQHPDRTIPVFEFFSLLEKALERKETTHHTLYNLIKEMIPKVAYNEAKKATYRIEISAEAYCDYCKIISFAKNYEAIIRKEDTDQMLILVDMKGYQVENLRRSNFENHVVFEGSHYFCNNNM